MISSSFYEYIARESIDSDLICLLCHNPFIDPIVTQCGYTYCRLCIETYMRSGPNCPSQLCNQLLNTDHLIPNPPLRNFISILDKLKVRCQLCEKTNINRGTFDEHIKTSCSEYQIDCPGKNIGCQWFGSRNEHDEHTKTCLFEKLRPMVDILYKVIKNQSLDIEKLQKQTEQQTTEIGQLNTQVDQQKTTFEQQTTELGQQNIQLEQLTTKVRQLNTQVDQQKAQFEQQKTESKQQRIQLDQQNIQLDQQKTQLEQLKAQLQQQQIQIGDIQSENQTQKNETASIRKQITILQEEINKLKSTALWLFNISANAKWAQDGVIIAGDTGGVGATNRLRYPQGLFVDDNQTVVIADCWNHRITQWKNGNTTNGQVVAGGNGGGNGLNQLQYPTDVLIDKETDSLIICDYGNGRVVRWSRHSSTTKGEILIDKIACWGLAMDEQRYLYVSDYGKDEVRRYQLGEKSGTLVAGGNGKGNRLNQLSSPTYLFVDRDHSVYVSDYENHRVMKWNKGAKEGIVVAGGQGRGNALTQLHHPHGLFVDTLGTLYVADTLNHRVLRWTQGGKKQGTVIVGGNSQGAEANQFSNPIGLSFDRHGNLYVADCDNHRVKRFFTGKDL
ncbi:unnamed protein product [Rotaria socialis]